MKKQNAFCRSTAILFLACIVSSMLSGCGNTLSGTYISKTGLIEQSFTFEEDNVVKMSAFGINVEGKYVIEDDEITITYSLLGLSYDWTNRFEKKGQSIFIDGTEFIKEK